VVLIDADPQDTATAWAAPRDETALCRCMARDNMAGTPCSSSDFDDDYRRAAK
jgi:hypothetical protein